jgi:hypothetical protein
MTGLRSTAFDLTFGQALRKRLAVERTDPVKSIMIPAVLLGRVDHEKAERLMYGYYESAKAEAEGLFQLFEAESIQFFIPQPQVRDMLVGQHLDLDQNGRITAKPRQA